MVRELLSLGADANCRGAVGDRALHLAAAKGSIPLTQLLLDAGADRNF